MEEATILRAAAGPADVRAQERAAALAEQAAGYVEYVAMMCDVELPEDDGAAGDTTCEEAEDE